MMSLKLMYMYNTRGIIIINNIISSIYMLHFVAHKQTINFLKKIKGTVKRVSTFLFDREATIFKYLYPEKF